MAGPGGGPPRRSHTKSRKGCDTCKRRHIRCDESFPQCRNCTKHKIRCPYNDMPMPEERSATPDKPDLMWTPEVEAAIEQWQLSGVFPFPNLNIYPAPSPQYLSVEEMRLIYHVASISQQMGAIDANGFTLWTRQIPTIIKIGATHRYVLHALVAFSAMHMAYINECPLVGNMAYVHRGIALKGLQEGIGTFSRETSDAVLAASLVLSWQATDWRSWTQLMQGTSSIIEAMDSWKHESQLGDFIAESSTFPTAPPSPSPDHKPSQPSAEDLDAFQNTIQQLQKVEAHLRHVGEDTKQFTQLVAFVKGARKVSPSLSVAQQFDRLQPLRKWLFWLPISRLQQTRGSPTSLIVIAHYYTVALLMERLFPEIGAAYFGSLAVGPVEEIARRLLSINIAGNVAGDLQTPLTLMEFPIDTVGEFRSRMGWVQPTRTPSFPQFNPPNFYSNEDAHVHIAASTPDYLPYGDHPAFSYSTEDLSVVSKEPSPAITVSPLQLASPFPNPHFLSIPSPFGGYSPASSTYGDFGDASIVYSDNEDFGTFDMGVSPTTPIVTGTNTYGIGIPATMAVIQNALKAEDGSNFMSSSLPSSAPSPFLSPQYTLLSLPESPIPATAFPNLPNHRHTTSTSSAPGVAYAWMKQENVV